MAVVMLTPTRALVDVFVGAADNPLRKPLRVRRRLANITEAETKRLEADIATRHTCGTRMAAKGVPLHVLMEQLGHKNPEMTMRYVHTSAIERRRVLVEKMEAE